MSKIYSHSRLWLFESCPEFYRLKYIDKNLPEIPTKINLFLGSAVHSSLEWLYRRIKSDEYIELDELIKNFALNWREELLQHPRLAPGEKPEEYFNKGIKFLINYYMNNKPFIDDTIEIEKKIIFSLGEDYKIQGFIDRLVKNSSGEYEVHDYKTSSFMKSQTEVDSDRQLAFYHLGLNELFGENIKVKLIWHFLAHGKKVASTRTSGQLESLKQETLCLIKKIESEKNWPGCGKPWCDWCEYKRVNKIILQRKEQDTALNNYY